MKIDHEFIDAVNQRSILDIKIMLKDSLVVDPTFAEFDEMLLFTKQQGLELYDKHDGEALKYDEKEWTKDYMNKQMVQLVYNFSEERVNLLKNICKKLYPQRIQMIENERRNPSNRQIKITKDKAATGLIALGTAATVGGIVIESAIGEIAIESAIAAGLIAIKPVVIATGVSMIVIGGAIKVIGGR